MIHNRVAIFLFLIAAHLVQYIYHLPRIIDCIEQIDWWLTMNQILIRTHIRMRQGQ